MNKLWDASHTMRPHSAVKRHKSLTCVIPCVNLDQHCVKWKKSYMMGHTLPDSVSVKFRENQQN